MSRFALICFDLDGTLVDSAKDIGDALRVALATVGPTHVERDAEVIAKSATGIPLHEFFAIARPEKKSNEAELQRFIDAYRAHYHAHLVDTTRAFEGVEETLSALEPLRAKGLRTAVATTKKTDTARKVTDALGLSRFFDVVLGTENIPHKPAPDLLHLAARTVERTGAPAMMVGDTHLDIRAGRAAKMTTCAVTHGRERAATLVESTPDHFIDRFGDLLELVR